MAGRLFGLPQYPERLLVPGKTKSTETAFILYKLKRCSRYSSLFLALAALVVERIAMTDVNGKKR